MVDLHPSPHPESLSNHKLLGFTPRLSDSGGGAWKPGTCISTSFQLMLMLLVWDHTLRTTFVEDGKRKVNLGSVLSFSPGVWALWSGRALAECSECRFLLKGLFILAGSR